MLATGVDRLQQKYADTITAQLAVRAAEQAGAADSSLSETEAGQDARMSEALMDAAPAQTASAIRRASVQATAGPAAEAKQACVPATQSVHAAAVAAAAKSADTHTSATAAEAPPTSTAEVIDLCGSDEDSDSSAKRKLASSHAKAAKLPRLGAPQQENRQATGHLQQTRPKAGWSMGVQDRQPAHNNKDSASSNPFWNPPQYVPAGGLAALEKDRNISTYETVEASPAH